MDRTMISNIKSMRIPFPWCYMFHFIRYSRCAILGGKKWLLYEFIEWCHLGEKMAIERCLCKDVIAIWKKDVNSRCYNTDAPVRCLFEQSSTNRRREREPPLPAPPTTRIYLEWFCSRGRRIRTIRRRGKLLRVVLWLCWITALSPCRGWCILHLVLRWVYAI